MWHCFLSDCGEVTFPALLLGRNWMGMVQELRFASVPQLADSACRTGVGRGHDPGEGSAMADVHVAFWFLVVCDDSSSC